jgi:putative ABC transport system permease protein
MGFDPDEFFRLTTVQWVAGDPETAIARLKDGTGLIVADRFLTTQKVKLGDPLTIGVGKVKKTFEIVGAVGSAGLDIATQSFGIRSQYMELSISCVFVDGAIVRDVFDNPDVLILQLNLVEGVDDEEVLKAIADVAPGVMFHSGRWIVKTINEVASAMMIVQSVIAFAALVLASLGVGNVILANIHGRRYEYGVLRAVGAHRFVLARLIFGEAIILAITGALLGSMLGMHLAWIGTVHYRDLAGLPMRLILPSVPTAMGWLVVIALTLLAALPGVWSVVRRTPAGLLAGGRNG